MIWIAAGLLLWTLAHGFKRFAPEMRARMGDPAKGAVSLALLASIVLMVIGYRSADGAPMWMPPSWAYPVNNLLMLAAVYLYAASGAKTGLSRRIRHPMLAGTIVWGLAHILVNPEAESLLLFGGMAAWSVLAMGMINRAAAWDRPPPSPRGKEIGVAVTSVVVFGAIAFVHGLVGPYAFWAGWFG